MCYYVSMTNTETTTGQYECPRCGDADCATDHDREDELSEDEEREALYWAREEGVAREREVLARYGYVEEF